MRRTTAPLFAAAILTLLVGAGCSATEKTDVKLGAEDGAINASDKTNDKMEGKVEGDASLDATIDAIIETDEPEQQEEAKVEDESNSMDQDKAELNAYGEGTYDIK